MLAIPAVAIPPHSASVSVPVEERTVFPVDIDVAQHPAKTAVSVRGENWQQADYENWLLPLDAVLEALALEVMLLDSGTWEVRSPDRTVNIDPRALQTDLELGLVVSAKQIETLFGVPVKFDPNSQTVRFSPPWLEREEKASEDIAPELLPQIGAPEFSITEIRQESNITNSWDSSLRKDKTDVDGELAAVGSLFGGSWFVRTEQSDLTDEPIWRLREAQYLYQSDFTDIAIGSQPTFWSSESSNRSSKKDYLGVTTLQRWGFTPPPKAGDSGFTPDRRLEANSSLPGQLPVGASALVVSAGIEREFPRRDNRFLGKLEEMHGGASYRHGLSAELTLGTGIVYEDSVKGLAELFYGPTDSPVKMKVSALSDAETLDINSQIRLDSALTIDLGYDGEDEQGEFKVDWNVLPGFSLAASGEGDELKTGVRYSHRSSDFSASINAEIDNDSNLLWKVNSHWGPLTLSSRRRHSSSNSELSYNLSGEGSSGHLLNFNYETRNRRRRSGDLTTVSWLYRSEKDPQSDLRSWEFELGYGFGSHGGGIVTSVATSVVSGVGVRLGYQEVSVSSDDSSFEVELVPNFNSSGQGAGERGFKRLREQGSIWIQPFFDKNNNGRQDLGEKLYTEKPNVLLLDDKPLKNYEAEIRDQGIFVELFPAIYRLKIDPAHLPPDWTSAVPVYEVEVAAGSYTTVLVPLTPSISGSP